MKPSAFDYESPDSEAAAIELLAEHGDEAKILAGGQSLIPLLNFRLARPALLIDINRIRSLDHLTQRDGRLWIGAAARQARVERSPLARRSWPMLAAALRWVAHHQIRNRGTIGGSAAHADPAAELPVALRCLDAVFHVRSRRGRRAPPASDFFLAYLTTALEPDELLVEIEVPAVPPHSGVAFAEFARRRGDFAIGGAAARISLDDDARCASAAIALLGAADVPLRLVAIESALVGRRIDAAAIAELTAWVESVIDPSNHAQAGSVYRRSLIASLAGQAVAEAAGGVRS